MDKYLSSVLDEWNGIGKDASPAKPDLMKRDPSSPKVDSETTATFRRRVARLLYLAKRTTPEILLPISFLSSQVNDVREEDMENLDRVFRYLNGNRYHWTGAKVEISAYIDASLASDEGFKGRTGMVLMCCGSMVGAWSARQAINTKSSTETELVGLTEDCTWALWARNWLRGQGYRPGAVRIYQDNLAVQDILKRGPSAEMRTRHLSIRYHFVGNLIKRNKVIIEYCPTEDMVANILTKPLVGKQFAALSNRLFCVN
jgi:hypothetical protein